MTGFALSYGLNAEALASAFATHGRLQVQNFLSLATAEKLLAELAGSSAWRLAVNRGQQIVDFSEQALADLSQEQLDKLDQAVMLGGRYDFQFRYDTVRLPAADDSNSDGHPALREFADFLSSPPIVALMRQVTGASDIDFADAHASRYRAGHFLTGHDDEVETMGRRAAYVLNLTREWRPDWGGLLLFHDEDGNIARGYTPGFNVLNLFSVPQRHSVSWVTPLAAAPRFAVTGWFRHRGD